MMMKKDAMYSIITCQICKKEIFVISDDVKICDNCNGYDQSQSELLD